MAFEPQRKTFTLPKSGKEITYRSEKIEDDVFGMKIATEASTDKEDRTSVFYMLQKVKILLGVEKFNGKDVKIRNYKEFQELAEELLQEPQDYKIIDQLYVKLNGDAVEAEAFVKNLLTATVS